MSAVVSGAALGTSAVTGSNGEFSLDLQSNSYSIKITADGFEDVTQIVDLRDAAAIAAPREFVLKLAPSRFAVTVMEAGYVTAETTTTTLRDVPQSITVVSKEQIRDQMMMSAPLLASPASQIR